MSFDPIAKIQIRASLAAGPGDLLQDRQCAQAACRYVGVEERVDRRERIVGQVGDRDRDQPAVQPQFQQAAIVPAPDQELVELRRAMVVHAAVDVTRAQVAPVQRQALVVAPGRQDARCDVGVARQGPALAAIGHEGGDRNAHRDAGPACRAVRPVEQVAGSAEAPAQRLRIGQREAGILGIEHEIAGHALGPVTAGVGAAVEQAQFVRDRGILVAGAGR